MMKKLATSGIALAAAQVAVVAPALPAFAAGQSIASKPLVTDPLASEAHARALQPVGEQNGVAVYEMTGYIVLQKADRAVQEFMLVSDMGLCPWCGNAGHGGAVEVQLADPNFRIEDGARITVRGALETLDASNPALSTRMIGAEIL